MKTLTLNQLSLISGGDICDASLETAMVGVVLCFVSMPLMAAFVAGVSLGCELKARGIK